MPILKAVIDTSVMISVAFAKKGLSKKLRDMNADGAFLPVTSKQILKELSNIFAASRLWMLQLL